MPRPPIEPPPDRVDLHAPCEAPSLPEPEARPAPGAPEYVDPPPDRDTPDCCPPEAPPPEP